MADDLGEKTEDPTSRRLQQARGRGQVAKSQDLAGAVVLLGGVVVIAALAPYLMRNLRRLTEYGLAESFGAAGFDDSVRQIVRLAVLVIGPVLAVMFVLAALSYVVQVGPLFTLKPLEPKLDRMNPIAGAKRLFSKRNLVKTVVNSLKLVVVVAVAAGLLWFRWERVVGLPSLEAIPAALVIAQLLLELAIVLGVLLLLMGVIDFLYQRWQHKEDLKMTKQEVKDERRSMEGDPQVKGRRFRMMQEIAMQRIRQEVPKADVILTNPTHYSVALRYDDDSMRAPRVVAKGVDHLALRIRELARAHAIVIVERPPLARGLYYHVDVGREIPAQFYEAVAEVLAYVYRVEREASERAMAGAAG